MCAPCKGCTYRHLGCHDNCNSYKDWVNAIRKEKEIWYKQKRIEDQLTNFRIENLRRYKKQHKK